jgi:transcriptional regulator with XRE-family HTH domain
MASKQTNGSRLQALLEERDMTQRELAHRLGTGEATVSRWVRGLTPSENNRRRIARRFKVEPEAIWPDA